MNRTLCKILKSLHPEKIPGPGSVVYNAVARTAIFQRNYDLLAADILKYRSEGSLLDVGTGPGYLLVKLHGLCPALRLTGLDASPAMVSEAGKNLKRVGLSDSIRVLEGFAQALPFEDESFDAVVSTGSIHHWKDPIGGLNEVYRVMRKGGHALMYDIVNDMPSDVLEAAAGEFGRLRVLLLWVHTFTEPFYSVGGLRGARAFFPLRPCRYRIHGRAVPPRHAEGVIAGAGYVLRWFIPVHRVLTRRKPTKWRR